MMYHPIGQVGAGLDFCSIPLASLRTFPRRWCKLCRTSPSGICDMNTVPRCSCFFHLHARPCETDIHAFRCSHMSSEVWSGWSWQSLNGTISPMKSAKAENCANGPQQKVAPERKGWSSPAFIIQLYFGTSMFMVHSTVPHPRHLLFRTSLAGADQWLYDQGLLESISLHDGSCPQPRGLECLSIHQIIRLW